MFELWASGPSLSLAREVLVASRVLVRRHIAGGRGILPVEAAAGCQVDFQHAIMAEIPGGNAGQRALPTAAP